MVNRGNGLKVADVYFARWGNVGKDSRTRAQTAETGLGFHPAIGAVDYRKRAITTQWCIAQK